MTGPNGSFWGGLICSVVGSLSLAASYPFSELVFKRGEAEEGGAISEEMVSTPAPPLLAPMLLAAQNTGACCGLLTR